MAKHRNRSQIVALKVQDTKLTDAFIRTLARDRQAHGEEVIQRVREDNPVACFKGMLSLVQKDVSLEGEIKRPQNPAGIRARTEKEAS